MARPRVQVQHAVLCPVVRQYGTTPTSDLLGVCYTYTYTPDLEFPRHIPQVDLFTRFFVYAPGVAEFFIRVWRLDGDGTLHTRMGSFGPYRVQFTPGKVFADRPFRMKNVRLEGVGVYAVRLCIKRRHRWRGVRYHTLATEYFQVVRSP